MRFRLLPSSRAQIGDSVRLRNGDPLTLESDGHAIGAFTDATLSGCLALGFAYEGVIIGVDDTSGVVELSPR